jgi:hypothetical protein
MNSAEEILEEALGENIGQDTRETINRIKNMMDKHLGQIKFKCETDVIAKEKNKIDVSIQIIPPQPVEFFDITFTIDPPYDKILKRAGITPI